MPNKSRKPVAKARAAKTKAAASQKKAKTAYALRGYSQTKEGGKKVSGRYTKAGQKQIKQANKSGPKRAARGRNKKK